MGLKSRVLAMAEKMHCDKELSYLYVMLFYPDRSLLTKLRNIEYPIYSYTTNDLVLFPIVYGARRPEILLQGLLSHALNLRGVRTEFILCDRKMPICLQHTINSTLNCHYCYYIGKKFASDLKIPIRWVGDFIKDTDITDANDFVSSLNFDEYYGLNYRGVNIGKYAEAATKRFLQTLQSGMIEDKEFNKNIFGKYLVSAILHVELSERILNKIKPTHLIISNIAYLPGVFVEYFDQKGVKCVACDFGESNGAINLNHLDEDRKDLYQIRSKTWGKYSAQILSDTPKKELEGLLVSRANGIGMPLDHGKFARVKSKEEIMKLLNIDTKKNIGVLFTNLPWDASLVGVDVVFRNSLEWVYETLSWFSRHDEKILIVKVHPAEEISGTRLSFLSYIHSKFPKLPENIKILPPKSEISTYGLFDVADYGIVYTTTAGLEMAIKGFPVITTAQTHYRKRGFTFDATNKEEYFSLLENTEKLEMTPQMMDLANKYGYLHFLDRGIPFKFIEFGGELLSSPKLKLNDWHELLPGSDKYLDMICDGIISHREFLRSMCD